jgi:hypothetical protein
MMTGRTARFYYSPGQGDELKRIIADYEKATEAARRDHVHVSATLQLFERDAVANGFPSRMSVIRVFWIVFTICKAVLAQAPAGMDTRELAIANDRRLI